VTINPADLAGMLDLMAQALRMLPAAQACGAAAPVQDQPQRTLAEWLDQHYRILLTRGYKAQTLKNRRSNLHHVRRLWGTRPVALIKPQEVAAGIRSFPADKTSTAGRVLSELRDVYVEAIAAGWAETSPAAHIKAPRHKVMRERLVLEVWQQMRTLARVSRQRWLESLLLLSLVIGQRRGDLAKVRFDDVVDGHLRIEQQKEAGKGYGARVEIPLTLRMDCIGMTLGDVIEHCRHSAKPGPTLLRQANGRAIEDSSLSTRFCETIRAVLGDSDPGTYKRPSLHEARSLSARCYVEQGMPEHVVQTLLGHSDAEMTALYLNDRGLSAKQWKRVEQSATC